MNLSYYSTVSVGDITNFIVLMVSLILTTRFRYMLQHVWRLLIVPIIANCLVCSLKKRFALYFTQISYFWYQLRCLVGCSVCFPWNWISTGLISLTVLGCLCLLLIICELLGRFPSMSSNKWLISIRKCSISAVCPKLQLPWGSPPYGKWMFEHNGDTIFCIIYIMNWSHVYLNIQFNR